MILQKVLYCPKCKLKHLDLGKWATKPHKTHLCAGCGHLWRPSIYTTVGVEKVVLTKREREILQMMADGGFIWYADGRRWPYPAVCLGRNMQRITRVMLERLNQQGWIQERILELGRWTGSFDITDEGKQVLGGVDPATCSKATKKKSTETKRSLTLPKPKETASKRKLASLH